MDSVNISFEQALARLEEIVSHMDRGDMPLEQSLALFEEGAALSGRCSDLLKKAEQTVLRLAKNNDGTADEIPFGGDF